jgi:hypothetical protein
MEKLEGFNKKEKENVISPESQTNKKIDAIKEKGVQERLSKENETIEKLRNMTDEQIEIIKSLNLPDSVKGQQIKLVKQNFENSVESLKKKGEKIDNWKAGEEELNL